MRALAGRIVRDGEALEALTPAWWDLWRRCPAATPFQSPAWLMPWWKHFAPGELFTMVVERDHALVGLAPFYREDGPWGRRLLPLGIPISDYHDVLLAPEEAVAAWDVVLELARQEPGWDLWEFEELMPDAAALGLPCSPDWERIASPQSACPTSSFSSRGFVESLPRARRQKLNLARNRAARRSCVEVRLADAASLRVSLDHLFRLHAMRWESRGESGVLSDEPIRRFHGAAAPALERAGLLRLTTLAIDGVVVAAQYGFQHRERAYHYLGGFDPAYAFESPGVLLLAHVIEDALRDGVREFHFLRGQEAYKYGWGAVDRWNQRLSFRRSGAQHGVE